MILYFFRHAEAEDSLSNDYERRLTERGTARTRTAARVMAQLDVRPDHLFSSPRVRARQTAEIVAEVLGLDITLERDVDFDNFALETVERLVASLDEDAEIMFVGHEPSFSEVVGDLTGGDVVMKKGGLARVDVAFFGTPLAGQLVWLIAPKIFDALADDD